MTKEQRLDAANILIKTIASCGRKFFYYRENISRLELDKQGRVWFIDKYSQKRIYTHCSWSKWRGFTEGGTLKSIIIRLRDFIIRNEKLPMTIFGPWPSWYCDGDLWGYGKDMEKVREIVDKLGIT